MKLYLDTCCWSRPCDKQSDPQIYKEAVAIIKIINQAQRKGFAIFGSITLEKEINENSDAELLVWTSNLYHETITEHAAYKKDVFDMWEPIAEAAGVKGWDIYHLCYAVSARVDYLLTVDKNFVKAAAKLRSGVKVINPLNFPLGGVI
ncbi:MAG: hypothetical protein LBC70_06045 [Chitinispirillales bacterium]|jgi:hypothetical protein|nr:hypothetical protein [Chitinispirillales bacterium]